MRNWEGLEEIVAIADAGSFVGGAKILGVSTSHISRAVARIEEKIGAQLLNRSTRRVALTATGRAFVTQVRHMIEARENLLVSISGTGEIFGEFRITCSVAMGELFIAPIARRYALENPRLTVTLDLNNRLVDLIGEGYDLAIRTGTLSDPRLVSHQLALRSYRTCAAPAYLATRGTPQHPAELKDHECLVGTSTTWRFLDGDSPYLYAPEGRWHCNSGSAVLAAALDGMGICQLPRFYVQKHVENGSLTPILRAYNSEPEPVWAVYPFRQHLLPKVRKFVAMMEETLPSAMLGA